MRGILSFSEMVSDEDDSLETVVTCEGNISDPDFPYKLSSLVSRLRKHLLAGDKPFHVTNVEPWNSVRVTFTIPREAAQRLRQLAQQGDRVLRELGILSVQVEGDQVISLTVAGRFNETQEIVLQQSAGEESLSVASTSRAAFSLQNIEGAEVPTPNSVETTRKNIAHYLSQQGSLNASSVAVPAASALSAMSPDGGGGSSLVPTAADFKSPNVVAPGSEPIPFPPKSNIHSPARTPPTFGPFPFASMTHAMNTMHGSQGHHQAVSGGSQSTSSTPSPRLPFSPPPYPGSSVVGGAFQPVRHVATFPHHAVTAAVATTLSPCVLATTAVPVSSVTTTTSTTTTGSSTITVNHLPRALAERANAALASPLLVNLLQSDVTSSGTPLFQQGCKIFPPPPALESAAAPKRKRKPRKSKEKVSPEGTATSVSPGASPLASPSSVLTVSSAAVSCNVSGDGSNSLQMFAQPFSISFPTVPSIPLSPPPLTPPSVSPPTLVGQPFTSVEPLSSKLVVLSGQHRLHHHHHHHRISALPSPPPTAPSSASTSNISGQSSQETELSPWPSPSKRTQHLVNPFTGQLEPMSSDDDSTDSPLLLQGDPFLDAAASESTSSGHFSEIGKTGSAGFSSASSFDRGGSANLSDTSVGLLPGVGVRSSSSAKELSSVSSSSSSASTSSSPSPPATPSSLVTPVSSNRSPSEKIKLRLKLEPKPRVEKEDPKLGEKAKPDPGSGSGLQYKVDVSFVNIPTSVALRRGSGAGLAAGAQLSAGQNFAPGSVVSVPLGGTSNGTTSAPPPMTAMSGIVRPSTPTVAPEPRVPPLHISLRGRNATVVSSPRREEREKLRLSAAAMREYAEMSEALPVVKPQRTRSLRGSRQDASKVDGGRTVSVAGKRNSVVARGSLSQRRTRGAAMAAARSISAGVGSASQLHVQHPASPPPSVASAAVREKALLSGGCVLVESAVLTSSATHTSCQSTAVSSPASSSSSPSQYATPVVPPHNNSRFPALPVAAVVSSVQIPRQVVRSESEPSMACRPHLFALSSSSAPSSPLVSGRDAAPACAVPACGNPGLRDHRETVKELQAEENVPTNAEDQKERRVFETPAAAASTSNQPSMHLLSRDIGDLEAASEPQALGDSVAIDRVAVQAGECDDTNRLLPLKPVGADDVLSPVIVKGITVGGASCFTTKGLFPKESPSGPPPAPEAKEKKPSATSPLCQQAQNLEDASPAATALTNTKTALVTGSEERAMVEAADVVASRLDSSPHESLERRTSVTPVAPEHATAAAAAQSANTNAGLAPMASRQWTSPSSEALGEAATSAEGDVLTNDVDGALRTGVSRATEVGVCVGTESENPVAVPAASAVQVDACVVIVKTDRSLENSVSVPNNGGAPLMRRDDSPSRLSCSPSLREETDAVALDERLAATVGDMTESETVSKSEQCSLVREVAAVAAAAARVNCVTVDGDIDSDLVASLSPVSRKLPSALSAVGSSRPFHMDCVEVPSSLMVDGGSSPPPKVVRSAKGLPKVSTTLGASEKLRLAAAVGASGVAHLIPSHDGHHVLVGGVRSIGCLPEDDTDGDVLVGDELHSGGSLRHHHHSSVLHSSVVRASVAVVPVSASPSSASPSGSSPDSLGDSSLGRSHSSDSGRMHLHSHHHQQQQHPGRHQQHHQLARGRCSSSNGSPYEDSGIDSMDAIMEKLSGGESPSEKLEGQATFVQCSMSSSTTAGHSKPWRQEGNAHVTTSSVDGDVQDAQLRSDCCGATEKGVPVCATDYDGGDCREAADGSAYRPVTQGANDDAASLPNSERTEQSESPQGGSGSSEFSLNSESILPSPASLALGVNRTVSSKSPSPPHDMRQLAVESSVVPSDHEGNSSPSPVKVPDRCDDSVTGKASDEHLVLDVVDAVDFDRSDPDDLVSSLLFDEEVTTALEDLHKPELYDDDDDRSCDLSCASSSQATQLLVFTVQDVDSIVMAEDLDHEMSLLEVTRADDTDVVQDGQECVGDVQVADVTPQSPDLHQVSITVEAQSVGEVHSIGNSFYTTADDHCDVSENAPSESDVRSTVASTDVALDACVISPVCNSPEREHWTDVLSETMSTSVWQPAITATTTTTARLSQSIAEPIASNPSRLVPLPPARPVSAVVAPCSTEDVPEYIGRATSVACPTSSSCGPCPVSGCATSTTPTVTLTSVIVKPVIVTIPATGTCHSTATAVGQVHHAIGATSEARFPSVAVSLASAVMVSTTESDSRHSSSTSSEKTETDVQPPTTTTTSVLLMPHINSSVTASRPSFLSASSPSNSSPPWLTNRTWLVPAKEGALDDDHTASSSPPTLEAHISCDPPHLQSPFLDLAASVNSCAEEEDEAEPFPRLSPAIDIEDGRRGEEEDSPPCSDPDLDSCSQASCDSARLELLDDHSDGFKEDADDLFGMSITSGDHNYIVRASRMGGERNIGHGRATSEEFQDRRSSEHDVAARDDCDMPSLRKSIGTNDSGGSSGNAGSTGAYRNNLDQLSIEIPAETDHVTMDGERRFTRSTRSSSMASPNAVATRQQVSPVVNSTSCPASLSPAPAPSPVEDDVHGHADNEVVRTMPNRVAAKRKREDSGGDSDTKKPADAEAVNHDRGGGGGHARSKSPLVVEMTAHFYSKPVKRKCSENAVELIKACIGVEDNPKRAASVKHLNMDSGRAHGGTHKTVKTKEDGKSGGGVNSAVDGCSEESSDDEMSLSELATKAKSGRSKHGGGDDRSVVRNAKQQRHSNYKEGGDLKDKANSRTVSNSRKELDGRSSRSANATSQRDSPHCRDNRVSSRAGRHTDRNRRATSPPRGQERSPQRISHRSRTRDNERGTAGSPTHHPARGEDGETGRRKLRSSASSVSGYYDSLPQKRRRMSRDHR